MFGSIKDELNNMEFNKKRFIEKIRYLFEEM